VRCHALSVYSQRRADIFRSKHLMTVWVASWQTIRSRVLPRWHVLQCDPIQCTRETHVLHLFTLGKCCWRETCSLSSNLKLSAYKKCLPTIIFSLSKTRKKKHKFSSTWRETTKSVVNDLYINQSENIQFGCQAHPASYLLSIRFSSAESTTVGMWCWPSISILLTSASFQGVMI
jgi:hypothetical protein